MMIKHSTPAFSVTAVEDETDSNRRCRRSSARSVRSNLGVVRDLSIAGVRLLTNRTLPAHVDVELFALDKSIRLRGKVAWSRRLDTFEVEVGLAFAKLTRAQTSQLAALTATAQRTPAL